MPSWYSARNRDQGLVARTPKPRLCTCQQDHRTESRCLCSLCLKILVSHKLHHSLIKDLKAFCHRALSKTTPILYYYTQYSWHLNSIFCLFTVTWPVNKSKFEKGISSILCHKDTVGGFIAGSCGSVCTYACVCVVVCPQWQSMPKEEQANYYKLAEKERQLHAQRFPEWTACDNYVCTVYYAHIQLIRVHIILHSMIQHGHCSWYQMGRLTCLSLCTGCKEEEDT